MSDLYAKHGISSKFFQVKHRKHKPVAYTVGELKEILKELPDDLPIETHFKSGVEPTVFNIDDDRHLMFEEVDE